MRTLKGPAAQSRGPVNTGPMSRVLPAVQAADVACFTQCQMLLAKFFDERSRNQSDQGDSQQLQDSLPREEGIQRGEGGQDGARLHADEIVRDQTWKTESGDGH